MAASTFRVVNIAGIAAAVLLVLAVAAGAAWVAYRDHRDTIAQAESISLGHYDAGRATIEASGCAACHTIPGIRRANATVGPSLSGIASRNYIAGILPNTPDNLTSWIVDPPAHDPKTAMPNLGLSPDHARDIAAYLYTLK